MPANQNRFLRLISHMVRGPWTIRSCFPDHVLDKIEAEVARGELGHSAELRVAIEHSLGFWDVIFWQLSSRARSIDVFSNLRVWDTEDNNGILVYILLADHAVELVADRGANKLVSQSVWNHACELMHDAFQYGSYDEGLIEAVRYLNDELSQIYPPGVRNPDELPNRPAIL